jgi:hypothetical protein
MSKEKILVDSALLTVRKLFAGLNLPMAGPVQENDYSVTVNLQAGFGVGVSLVGKVVSIYNAMRDEMRYKFEAEINVSGMRRTVSESVALMSLVQAATGAGALAESLMASYEIVEKLDKK